ncbi:MAG: hypothetical protein H7841_12615 [Magnetospirillum sp. WYHS-4]
MPVEANVLFDALEVLWAGVKHKFMSSDFDRESGLKMAVEEATFAPEGGPAYALDRVELTSGLFGRRVEYHVTGPTEGGGRREVVHVGRDFDADRYGIRVVSDDPKDLERLLAPSRS